MNDKKPGVEGLMKRYRIAVLLLVALVLLPVQGMAADQAQSASEKSDLEYYINVYAWLPSISGSMKAFGRTRQVDADFFEDILPELRFGAMVHGELLYRNTFGFSADFVYASLHSEVGANSDIYYDMIILDLLPYYRFGTFRFGETDAHTVSVDVLAGARIWGTWLDIDADLRRGERSIHKDRVFADPIIAARTVFTFGENWLLSMRGGIGGFGVGSNFTWDAVGMLGYRVTDVFSINLGYKAIGLDYTTLGSPSVRLNLILHGPFIGLGFMF